MEKQIRCVHYLNQFFGKVGGEEKANTPLHVVEGPVGPGTALQNALQGADGIVATVVSGDNYFIEQREKALDELNRALDRLAPDLVLAGPAFDAGRYGLACAEVCKAAQRKGIPAVTAMFPENPGVVEHGREVYIFPTGKATADMAPAIEKMVAFGKRLVGGAPTGTAEEEGYLPRGIRRTASAKEPGYKRAVDILAMKVHGKPFKTEIPVILPEKIKPAPPLSDIGRAEIALVTTCGLIRKNNPEGQVSRNADRFFRHSVEGIDALKNTAWEAYHAGYYDEIASEDPNYILPLRQMRFLENEKFVGGIHPWIFTLAGVSTPVAASKKIGRDIAQELVDGGVDGVLLTAA
jgi:glycine reductase